MKNDNNYETVYNGLKVLFTDTTKKQELINEVKVYLLNKNGTLKKKLGSMTVAWHPLSGYVFEWISEHNKRSSSLDDDYYFEMITGFIDNTHLGCSFSNQFGDFFSIKTEPKTHQEKIKKLFDDFAESFFEKYVKKA